MHQVPVAASEQQDISVRHKPSVTTSFAESLIISSMTVSTDDVSLLDRLCSAVQLSLPTKADSTASVQGRLWAADRMRYTILSKALSEHPFRLFYSCFQYNTLCMWCIHQALVQYGYPINLSKQPHTPQDPCPAQHTRGERDRCP